MYASMIDSHKVNRPAKSYNLLIFKKEEKFVNSRKCKILEILHRKKNWNLTQ